MAKSKKFHIQSFPGVQLRLKEDGTIGVRKIGLTAERVRTDPAFAVTLANAFTFGIAAAWASRMFRVLKPVLTKYKIKCCHKRLLACLMTGLSASRNPSDKLIPRLMSGFRCNRFSFVQQKVHRLAEVKYTDDNTAVTAILPPLLPAIDMNPPIGAIYCKLSLVLAWVCWPTGDMHMYWQEKDIFYRINNVPTDQVMLSIKDPGFEKSFVLAAVGIQFFNTSIDEQELYPYNNGKHDTLDILDCRLLPSPPPSNPNH